VEQLQKQNSELEVNAEEVREKFAHEKLILLLAFDDRL